MRSVDASSADIYFFDTSDRQNSQKKFQEGCPMRAISDSLVDNISSNEPIGDQLKHGLFIPNLISLKINSTEKKLKGMPYEIHSFLIDRNLFLRYPITDKLHRKKINRDVL